MAPGDRQTGKVFGDMSGRSRFKQVDATRALKAALDAGLPPSECIIDGDGAIRLIFRDGSASPLANPLDRLLPR